MESKKGMGFKAAQKKIAKIQNGGVQPPKKKSPKATKPVSTLKREVTTYSKGSDGSTRTEYPKKVSSSGTSSQLTRITTPVKKKKGM
jgi:hypothetical protein